MAAATSGPRASARLAMAGLALVALLASCTAREDGETASPSAAPAPNPPATSPPATGPSDADDPSPAASPTPSPTPSPTLEARYAQDSDGNAVPDFIETEIGSDPLVDDCAQQVDCPGLSELGDAPLLTEQNVLLILDSSGSMAGADGAGTVKIDAAKAAVERYVVGTPDLYDVGLMVYGHRGNNEASGKAESCAGIEVFAPLGEFTAASAPGVLAQFSPTGWTPLAASLDRAAQVFAGSEGEANRVVLVTDGIETCEGDAVAAAQRLKQAEISATVDVVGLDVADSGQEAALRQVAEITGGTYTTATTGADLATYFDSLVARQVTVVNSLACLLRSASTAEVCSLRLEADAERAITREAIDSGDPARVALLQALQARISQRSQVYAQQLREANGPRIDELLAALEDARRRYQERYGAELSLGPGCPSLLAAQDARPSAA